MKNRMMLRGHRHQMLLCILPMASGKSENRKIAAFGSPRGENDLVRLGSQQGGEQIPGIVNRPAGTPAGAMDAGGVADKIPQPGKHGLSCRGAEGGGGIVIEVNHPDDVAVKKGSSGNKTIRNQRPVGKITFHDMGLVARSAFILRGDEIAGFMPILP